MLKVNKVAFIYLAEGLWFSISKDPVASVEILDSDRHQRESGWLPLTDKNADKTTTEAPLSGRSCSVSDACDTNGGVLTINMFYGKGMGRWNFEKPVNEHPPRSVFPQCSGAIATEQ